MKLWVLPPQVWLPLALAALAPLVLAAVIVPLSRRRARGIATVLTLRNVLLLGFGFATLAAVATIAVVTTGLRELAERHSPGVRALSDALGENQLGPLGANGQLALALYRAKDPNVAFVAAGGDQCTSTCLMSANDMPADEVSLKARLISDWPQSANDQRMIAIGDRTYLLISSPVFDASGAAVAHAVAVVAGIDATYIARQATRTAWILLAIAYVLLIVVGWSSWRQVSRSLATRMEAISTQLRSGTVDESIELLEADGHELRELANSVTSYIKRTLEQQKSSDERHRRLVELSPDAIFICSAAGIRFANSAALSLAGVNSRHDLLGKPIDRFLEVLPRPTGVKRDVSISALRPARWKRLDGAVLQVEVAEITDTTGDDTARQYVVRDVTHQQLREADLAHRAEHDAMTGLVNRSRFLARLSDLVQCHASRRSTDAREAAVLFIDLDGFKPVNDQYGHAAGDAVLVAVAERLRESTRGTDVVARLGGDEFAVLLDIRDADELRMVAERVLRSLRQPVLFDRATLSVGASIGVASAKPLHSPQNAPAPGDSSRIARELMRAADTAMYAAKAAGGDRFHMSDYPQESTDDSPRVSFPAVA